MQPRMLKHVKSDRGCRTHQKHASQWRRVSIDNVNVYILRNAPIEALNHQSNVWVQTDGEWSVEKVSA